MNVDQVEAQAGELVRTKSEDEIYAHVGSHIPPEVITILLRVHQFAEMQLTAVELKLLPKARTLTEKSSLGRTITEATKRVVWRAVCDPTSEVYKVWCTNGMMGLLDKKILSASLVAMLSGLRIGALVLASALAALILRTGLDVFCEVAKPASLMIGRDEKR